ncbi:hypothetical protein [Flavobacterium gawalongense]|uniref:Cytochrome c domain-containing protein n=1 Tax=Flavobacterium gawalongense TaxID=2594432 RepID=A0A553BL69_9FLAO|nr:hypothetical protein [Flavobacterium gawalongense]TRW97095.1 hypothetical protein FNW33_16770 [Flavobacterium gawalongense]TRX01819.1 hypothetical protein FNW12_16880 [Flavobacterium gawalongense]TRX08990.1 hypothetical protein FNW11_10650 [Flavobacterium gawalongense]TRX10023.1 hypothetical protein FNW10_10150 [Flavobacterium gawalongense]TRX26944.1 hypothetical protein FNW38_10160 [Flavobacterium gawalongense]
MKIEKVFTLAILAFLIVSCSSGSESDIAPSPNPTPGSITYTNNIKSIINNNCISCHDNNPTNGASVSLDTYARVKNATENNGLIDRISRAQGTVGMMPKNGTRLPQSTIDMFINWKNNGYLE